ncbi:hypothetical protein PDIDSM_6634 [Penicillium digitatum]|nr:hypothetical protein PDIDSM_6634 [Penicillium digitatum]
MPYKHEPMAHWTQQIMRKVTKAQSLVHESHQLLIKNDEAELSAEFRQMEGTLVVVLEESRLRLSPPSAHLPPSLPRTGPRRDDHPEGGRFPRGPSYGNPRPQPTQGSQTQICANFHTSICVEDETSVIKLASYYNHSTIGGVLCGFEEDSTVIELLPGIVATMEAWKIVYDEQTGPLEVG